MNVFITSDEIVPGTNTFGAGDEHVHIGNEHFSAGEECIENARLSVNDTAISKQFML